MDFSHHWLFDTDLTRDDLMCTYPDNFNNSWSMFLSESPSYDKTPKTGKLSL